MSALYSSGRCSQCELTGLLIPLHGDAGGPLLCPICVGKWQAEHGKKRRAGRVVIRAGPWTAESGDFNDEVPF